VFLASLPVVVAQALRTTQGSQALEAEEKVDLHLTLQTLASTAVAVVAVVAGRLAALTGREALAAQES